MTLSFETTITPSRLLKECSDVSIKNPPIINTSLHEMASHGYSLYVNAKYCPTYKMSKASFLFRGHDGFAGINHVMWVYDIFRKDQDVINWLNDTAMGLDYLEPHKLRKKDAKFFKLPDPIVQKEIVTQQFSGPLDSTYDMVSNFIDSPVAILKSKSSDDKYLLFNFDDELNVMKFFNDRRALTLRAPVRREDDLTNVVKISDYTEVDATAEAVDIDRMAVS